jgi:H+/Cl- antiporter ClcA
LTGSWTAADRRCRIAAAVLPAHCEGAAPVDNGHVGWRLMGTSVLTGVAAGLAGAALTTFLHAVQHLAFGYTENTFLVGVQHASSTRRVLALAIGGVVVALGWWLYRRISDADVSVRHALTLPAPRMPLLPTVADATLQIVAVGVGASLGREGAPRRVGAALGSALAERAGLDAADRRIVLAAGAGAGLAAVYNVPLGGAVFALEAMLGGCRPRAMPPALVASLVATVVAWPALGRHATYQFRAPALSWDLIVAAAVVGVLAALLGNMMRAVVIRARTHALRGGRAVAATVVVFTGLGALGITYPSLLGNGKGLAQLAFDGSLGLATAAALAALKPIATAACLGAGAAGGLLTPSFATGAALGAFTGQLWTHLWPGAPVIGCALAGAAAVLAVTQRAPVTAAVLAMEFTHARLTMLVPVAVAILAARLTAPGQRCGRANRRRVSDTNRAG